MEQEKFCAPYWTSVWTKLLVYQQFLTFSSKRWPTKGKQSSDWSRAAPPQPPANQSEPCICCSVVIPNIWRRCVWFFRLLEFLKSSSLSSLTIAVLILLKILFLSSLYEACKNPISRQKKQVLNPENDYSF